MMYLRFVTCLAVGLFGLSLLMMTVYDALFQDWDVVTDIKRWAAAWARRHRTRYVMMDDEVARAKRLATRAPLPERASVPYVLPEVSLPPVAARDLTSV